MYFARKVSQLSIFPCRMISTPLHVAPFLELQTREAQENTKAEKVRQQKTMAEESKQMTIEDLTKGMINYKYLCLDFEKAEEERLRYVDCTHLFIGAVSIILLPNASFCRRNLQLHVYSH